MRKTAAATEPDQMLTLAEVAEILRVEHVTLRTWRFKGIGPTSFKIGSLVRYMKSDLDAWMKANYGETSVGGGSAA